VYDSAGFAWMLALRERKRPPVEAAFSFLTLYYQNTKFSEK
jgi:hypothetical protein